MKKLSIHQIHFDERSQANCYDGVNLYDNSGQLTEYFENSVILDLISRGEHKKAEYFAVFSHDIKHEIRFTEWLGENKLYFNPENLETVISQYPRIDFFSFQRRRKNTNIVTQAEHYHPGIIKAFDHILKETGFMSDGIPKRLRCVVLFNHFVARSEIYEQYVRELLVPAMKVMQEMPELFQDAKYKPTDEPTRRRFTEAFGKPFYPYHPFICERLPSVFLEKHKHLKFKHIF